jgi:Biotin-lipoyl like
MWLGTLDHGIIAVDTVSFRTHLIRHDPTLRESLENGVVYALFKDRSGLVWLCSDRAISRYDPGQSAVHTVFGDSSRHDGLTDAEVDSILDQRTALLDELQIDRTEVPQRPSGGRRRAWLIGIGTVVFATAIGVALRLSGPESVPVRAVIARGIAATSGSRAVESLLEASGYVIALREATVSGKSIYKVEEVLVQEGQPVKQGQVIARLDDSNARAALDQTKAQVKQFAAALARRTRLAAVLRWRRNSQDRRHGFSRSRR